MKLKVKDLLVMLEMTDPECEVKIEIRSGTEFFIKTNVEIVTDDGLGSIKLIGFE